MGALQDAKDQYYRNLTDEQVEDLVRQGMNREEMLTLRADAIAKEKERLRNEVDLSRLDAHRATPRDIGSDFVKNGCAGAPLFGKGKWLAKIAEAPLAYGAVVQAHSALFSPGRNYSAGMVLVFAADEKHRCDVDFLRSAAQQIGALKRAADVPADMQDVINPLRNDHSFFCRKVGASIAGDADLWCAVHVVKDSKVLPKMFIPNDKIIPLMVLGPVTKGATAPIALVRGEYYGK